MNINTENYCNIDVPTTTLNINRNLKSATVRVSNEINKFVNNGADIYLRVAEDASIDELISRKGSNGQYGKYILQNSEEGDIVFNIQFAGVTIEEVSMYGFGGVPGVNIPIQIPSVPGLKMTNTTDKTYEFSLNGKKVTVIVTPESNSVTITGSADVKITNLTRIQ